MPRLRILALFTGIAAMPVISLMREAGRVAWTAPVSLAKAGIMLAIFALVFFTTAIAALRVMPNRPRTVVAAVGWFTMFFVHAASIRGAMEAAGWVSPWQWSFLTLAAGATSVWIAMRFDTEARALTTFVPILAIAQLVLLAVDVPRWNEPAPAVVASSGVAVGSPPSIWFIVLDSHPSPRVLRDLHAIDLSGPTHDLEAEGFRVWDDARTNYSHTLVAVPSVLSGQTWEPEALETMQADLIAGVQGDTPLVAALKDAGHTIRMMPSNWSRSRCGDVVDVCRRIRAQDEHWFFLANSTPLTNILPRLLAHPWPAAGLRTLESIGSVGDEPLHFTFVHSLASHPPTVIGEDCVPTSVYDGNLESQLLCTHHELREAVASIDLTDDVVIITSDHGYEVGDFSAPHWSKTTTEERFSAFTAISTPDGCEDSMPELLSGAQLLPMVLNCYGADLPVPEHRFYRVHHQRFGGVAAVELTWDGWSVDFPE